MIGTDSPDAPHNVHEDALRQIAYAHYESAFHYYKRLIFELNYVSPDILSEAGFVCWRLGMVDEAEESFRRALEAQPTHFASLINVVDMRLSLGIVRPDTSGLIKQLLDHYPQDAEARLLVAKFAFFEGNKDKGCKIAVGVGREFATDQVAQLLACKLLLEYGCYSELFELAKANLAGSEPHPSFFDYAAKAHISLSQFEQAEQLYQLAIERYPDRLMPHCGRAHVKFAQADFAGAIRILDGVLDKVPEHADANRLYWFSLAALKDWETLVGVTSRYLDSDPPPLLPLLFRIAALGQLGRLKEVEGG